MKNISLTPSSSIGISLYVAQVETCFYKVYVNRSGQVFWWTEITQGDYEMCLHRGVERIEQFDILEHSTLK